jgi:hypothetical protein
VDEQLDEAVATTLNALLQRHGHSAESLRVLASGTLDPDIPAFCREHGFDVLLTANVRDFGAKLLLYERLLDEGISVVVVRPGKQTLNTDTQVAIVAFHLTEVVRRLAAAQAPILLRETLSEVKERSLAELRAEIRGEGEGLP